MKVRELLETAKSDDDLFDELLREFNKYTGRRKADPPHPALKGLEMESVYKTRPYISDLDPKDKKHFALNALMTLHSRNGDELVVTLGLENGVLYVEGEAPQPSGQKKIKVDSATDAVEKTIAFIINWAKQYAKFRKQMDDAEDASPVKSEKDLHKLAPGSDRVQ